VIQFDQGEDTSSPAWYDLKVKIYSSSHVMTKLWVQWTR